MGHDWGLDDERVLTAQLLAVFEADGYRPPRLPRTATQLIALAQQPDVSLDAIERVLEQDAMLAAEVLSIANSAFCASAHPARTLRQGLVRIGIARLGEIVLAAAMNLRVFRSKAYAGCMERLQLHSTATAHFARIVARYTSMHDEHAFLCGLLHDVGFAGILLVLGEVPAGRTPPDLAALWPAIGRAHTTAGARMTALWQLPADVSMVISAHHEIRIDKHVHPLAATVCVAEALAGEFGLGLVNVADATDKSANPALAALAAHGSIDCSTAATLELARDALKLGEPQLKLIRADAAVALRDIAVSVITTGARG